MKNLSYYMDDQNLFSNQDKVSTGYRSLDRFFEGEGLGAGELIVIGGRPGMGKTTFAINISLNIFTKTGLPILYFSLNEPASGLVPKILSIKSAIPLQKLYRSQNMRKDEIDTVVKAMDSMKKTEINFHDSDDLKNEDIVLICNRFKNKNGVGAIIVDDIQSINMPRENGIDTSCRDLMNSLRAIGRSLNCPILILSQLNRKIENRKSRRPQLMDLKGSSEIESKSDMVIFLYRDECYYADTNEPGIAEIIVSKNRRGEVGMCKLRYSSSNFKFSDM